ncbi:hypothetical protein Q9S71_00820 [Microbacterium sp. KSW4-11]|uniref:PAS domain-containing protein n=1 Tax=Microbacterium gawkjiense TaxID=3067309 RepID=A0ABU3G6C2_9MICO|nr:hypothetical protein [Microbacterium sp. KSW4-11]MDT3315358.1 hypothetical protein [Microbacterium sp. KSW4-11]
MRTRADALEAWEEQVALFAIVKLDPDGIVRGWNAGAETLKGYTADEIRRSCVTSAARSAPRMSRSRCSAPSPTT